MGIRLRSLSLPIAALLVLAAALAYSTRSTAAPSIAWTPASLTQSVDAGQSKTTVVSFKASENLSNVGVWVVPALQPYMQTTPTAFASIAKGQIVTLTIGLSAPVTAPTATINGTIHLRSGSKTIAKPLPVAVAINGLPPDPGGAGNATVQGVDVNANGVRDDVERWIVFRYSAPVERSAAIQAAKAIQKALLSDGEPALSNAAAIETVRAGRCMEARFIEPDRGAEEYEEIVAQHINTDARFLAERKWLRNIKGLSWGAFPNDGCDI